MSDITPFIGLLRNLKGELSPGMEPFYLPVDAAHKALVKRSGVDFGLDAEKWEAWIRKNTTEFELVRLKQQIIERSKNSESS